MAFCMSSDVATSTGTIFNDLGRVRLSLAMKDVSMAPSSNNNVTITRYRVEYTRAHPADSWLDRSPTDRCIMYHGVPPLPSGYNNTYQIFQTPGWVAILDESVTTGTVVGLLLILAGSWLSTDGRLPPGLVALVARVQRRRASGVGLQTPR